MWLWCGLVSDILNKSRLNWKLIVSNTDNAGITQSQERDTRYPRMLVNALFEPILQFAFRYTAAR